MALKKHIDLIFLSFLLILLPFEKLQDRFFRPFLKAYTDIPKPIIKSLYAHISDGLIILLFVWVFYRYKRKKRFFFEGNAKWALCVGAFVIISSFLFGIDLSLKHYVKLFYFSLSIIFFCTVLQICRENEARKYFPVLCYIMILLGSIQAVLAICQYFSQGAIGLRWLGEVKNSLFSGQFENSSKVLSVFDYFQYPSKDYAVIKRTMGTFTSPNVLGGFLCTSLLLSFPTFESSKKSYGRLLLFISISLQIFALVTTFSRSALFACILGSLYFFISSKASKKLVLLSLFSLSISITILFPVISSRGGIVNYNAIASSSDQGRLGSQQVAFQCIKEHLFFGVGLDNFPLYYTQIQSKGCPQVHNMFLLLLAESGLFALAAFVLLLIFSCKRGWFYRKDLYCNAFLTTILAFVLIGFFDYYLLFFQCMKLLLLLILGVLSSYSLYDSKKDFALNGS